ncbi:MAG: TetR/AcrR family transcriptional regulator [Lautropia sp.]
MASALRLFVQRGFRDTTVDQIADECGLTKGAVYHYYGGKEDLLLALLSQIESQAIHTRDNPRRKPGETAAHWLDRYIKMQGIQAAEHPHAYLLLVILSADMSSGPRVAEKVSEMYSALRRTVEEIISEGQESGEFSRDWMPSDLGLVWLSAFSGNVLHWHRSGRTKAVGEALLRALRLTFTRALLPH